MVSSLQQLPQQRQRHHRGVGDDNNIVVDRRDNSVDDSVDVSDVDRPESQSQRYVCPHCGKKFDSEMALEMHSIRVHKRSAKPKETKKEVKVTKVPPIREEGEALVPDAETQLKNFLITFGLSERDANATIEFMRAYGLDNLEKLNEALTDLGVSLSRRKIIIESWSNLRNIKIPPSLMQKLGIRPVRQEYMDEYPYFPQFQQRKQGMSETAELIRALAEFQKAMIGASSNSSDSSENMFLMQQIQELRQQNEQLRKELEERERRRELEEIRREISELKDSTVRVHNQYSVISDAIRELTGLIKEYFNLARSLISGRGRSEYVETEESRSHVYKSLPEELVVEE